jgi:hypothetical protein
MRSASNSAVVLVIFLPSNIFEELVFPIPLTAAWNQLKLLILRTDLDFKGKERCYLPPFPELQTDLRDGQISSDRFDRRRVSCFAHCRFFRRRRDIPSSGRLV